MRERAYPEHEDEADAYVDALADKEAMFNAIVDERALEFCGEFLRKADLIRWNLLKTKLDEAKADMLNLCDLNAPYDNLTGDIWYADGADGKSVDIHFQIKGEVVPKGVDVETGYVNKYNDSKSDGFYKKRIDGIYTADPVQHMFWPIFNDTMTNSQGRIKNDYGYSNL